MVKVFYIRRINQNIVLRMEIKNEGTAVIWMTTDDMPTHFYQPIHWNPGFNIDEWECEIWTESTQIILVGNPNSENQFEILRAAVDFSGQSRHMVAITWQPNKIALSFNALSLVEIEPSKVKDNPSNLGSEITHEDAVFLNTLTDIREKIESESAYEHLKVCGLLRHLLLDQHPLIHKVNRNRRLPIKFIGDFHFHPQLNPHYYVANLLPKDRKTFKEAFSTLDLQQFLQSPVLLIGVTTYSVREVIQHCSNLLGGVHLVPPKKDDEIAIVELLSNSTNAIFLIKQIANVVLAGLEPLENNILGTVA